MLHARGITMTVADLFFNYFTIDELNQVKISFKNNAVSRLFLKNCSGDEAELKHQEVFLFEINFFNLYFCSC